MLELLIIISFFDVGVSTGIRCFFKVFVHGIGSRKVVHDLSERSDAEVSKTVIRFLSLQN